MAAGMFWAVVADGGRLRVLSQPHRAASWAELPEFAEERHSPPAHLLGSDRPGRNVAGPGGARHALEPRSDPHERREAAFAAEIAARLEAAAEAGRFARLLLAAPPRFLGELRRHLGPRCAAALGATLDADLTKLPEHDLSARLAAAAGPAA
jgi:protein required for attachment to host cells